MLADVLGMAAAFDHLLRFVRLLVALPFFIASVPAQAEVAPVLAATKLDRFDQLNFQAGTLLPATGGGYTGPTSFVATFGGQGNGYARGIFNVSWGSGDDVWYRAAYKLPKGFKAAMQGQVALLRWDNYISHPVDTDHGGVVIYGSDKRARLVTERLNGQKQYELTPQFDVPEGRWFLLEVHQRFSATDGRAINEVFLDGKRMNRSTKANLPRGRRVERIRYGLVAIDAGKQRKPLKLRFDDAAVAASGPARPAR